MMKIDELQVGDWVAIDEPDAFHGYTGRVRVIGGNTNYVTVHIPNLHEHDVLVDDLSPIPLTPDKLRKFCIYEYPRGSKRYNLDGDFYLLENLGGTYTLCVKYYDGYVYDYKEVIGCDSVSKLQQAIRLLNIDKEIISCGI